MSFLNQNVLFISDPDDHCQLLGLGSISMNYLPINCLDNTSNLLGFLIPFVI